MKEPREWDEEYLLNLPLGEHNWVEMKGRRTVDLTAPGVAESKVRDDLSKAISALANSGGGALVLGLKELPNGWAVDDGGVALSVKGKMSTREWLEDVIPNLVEESLVNFNVYVITRGAEGSQIEEGRGVFVVEVGDSEQAPHQASDNKYYARVGGKSRSIGHRLVTDILNRRRHPKLSLEVGFSITRIGSSNTNRPFADIIDIDLTAKNSGRVFANYVVCIVEIPEGIFGNRERSSLAEGEGKGYVTKSLSNTRQDLIKSGLELEYGTSWYAPVLPGLSHRWSVRLFESRGIKDRLDLITLREKLAHMPISWRLYADNAPVETGSIIIGEVEVKYTDISL